MTLRSIQSGISGGSPNGVTPPMAMPVIDIVWSLSANDAFLTPSRSRTAWFNVETAACQHHAGDMVGGCDFPTTRIVLAESSKEYP